MEIKNLAQQYIYWPEIDNIYQKNIDFSQVKISQLNELFENQIKAKRVSVENTIIRFYALNEILAKLRQKDHQLLDEKAINLYKQYTEEIENSSKKLFTYIFFISLIEARHCYELKRLKNLYEIIEEEDYDKTQEYESELSSEFSSLREKNRQKYYRQKNELDEQYSEARYDYSNPLYNEYNEKVSLITARYEKVKKRIETTLNNLVEKFSEKLSETRDERLEASREQRLNDIMNTFLNRYEEGEDISQEKLLKFMTVAESLIKIGNAGRSAVYETIMPVLQQETFNDFTLEDLMKCIVNVFKFGDFEHGYGGEPWAKIAQHGLSFARGKINAEVFVDQAFSLEHNNGNMFNKRIIFNNASDYYWKTYSINEEHDYYSNSDSYTINNCQFLLNAQHQGQLLSLLSIDIESLQSKVGQYDFYKKYDEVKTSGLIPQNMTLSTLENIDMYTNENIDIIRMINQGFHNEHENFKNIIKESKVEIPQINMFSLINGCKVEGDKICLSKSHNLFHSLTDYKIKQYNNSSNPVVVKNKNYNFNFEYLDTKIVPNDKLKKEILGNKAFGLAQMHEMNLPVPQALVFPTTNANSYFNDKAKWLNNLRPELNKIKNNFTDSDGNPIACSVRSGSSISMPGMMDTILNVGIDDSNYDYFCQKMGKNVTNECITKFMTLFTKSLFNEEIHFSSNFHKALHQFREVLNRHEVPQNYDGKFPLNARQQYKWCLQAVFQSWHSERATAYRNHQGIDHDIGTAAIVQAMVFGNLNENSCTGVVFSRDCISGEKGIIGEFLPKAQGEDVVSGAVTPKNIKLLKDFNPQVYSELIKICERLEKDTGDIQDIEFTVEDGKLYILQKRKAVCSSLAQNKLNSELYSSGLITEQKMLESINIDSLMTKDILDTGNEKPKLNGLIGNPGIIRGIVITCEEDMVKYSQLHQENNSQANFGWIFYAPETSPDHAPIMLKTQGFITSNGGFTSHAAILARSWDKPCIVGVGNEANTLLKSGSIVTMDANNGSIYEKVLPLKEGSKAEVQGLIDKILDYYKINLKDLSSEPVANEQLLQINNKTSWMQQYPVAQIVVEEKEIKTEKFLDLGHKVALMLLKAQEESKKMIKEQAVRMENNNISSLNGIVQIENSVQYSKMRMF